MKKYLYFFIAGLLSLNLLACNPVNGSTENSDDTSKTGEITDTEGLPKKEGYEILVGTKWNLEEREDFNDFAKKNAYKTVIFKQDEIIVDYFKYKGALTKLKKCREQMLLHNKNYSEALSKNNSLDVAISSRQWEDELIEEYKLKQEAKKYAQPAAMRISFIFPNIKSYQSNL